MPLEDALRKSEQWMENCVALVNTLTVPSENRTRVSAALHQLSIEHYTGIHVLVGTGVYSAGFALYRPQIEAYIRGAWHHKCATDEQLNNFIAGKQPPSVKLQIKALEENGAFDPGSFMRFKEMTWRNLCDFTHGGTIQVKVRASSMREIGLDFKPEHLAALLTASSTTALLASVGLAAVAENDQIAVNLRDAFNAIYVQAA
jgi:hypothetical protein